MKGVFKMTKKEIRSFVSNFFTRKINFKKMEWWFDEKNVLYSDEAIELYTDILCDNGFEEETDIKCLLSTIENNFFNIYPIYNIQFSPEDEFSAGGEVIAFECQGLKYVLNNSCSWNGRFEIVD